MYSFYILYLIHIRPEAEYSDKSPQGTEPFSNDEQNELLVHRSFASVFSVKPRSPKASEQNDDIRGS